MQKNIIQTMIEFLESRSLLAADNEVAEEYEEVCRSTILKAGAVAGAIVIACEVYLMKTYSNSLGLNQPFSYAPVTVGTILFSVAAPLLAAVITGDIVRKEFELAKENR
jgi:hypothetical protein